MWSSACLEVREKVLTPLYPYSKLPPRVLAKVREHNLFISKGSSAPAASSLGLLLLLGFYYNLVIELEHCYTDHSILIHSLVDK